MTWQPKIAERTLPVMSSKKRVVKHIGAEHIEPIVSKFVCSPFEQDLVLSS